MNGIVLAFGEEMLVGGRASTEMIEEGVLRHDVLWHVGTFGGFDFSAGFGFCQCVL